MKLEDGIPESVRHQQEDERLHRQLWCATVALLVIGGLLWGGVLVVNYPRPYSAGESWPATIPPAVVHPAEDTVAPRVTATAPEPAPIGGPGIVWVNTQSKVYHFPGYHWYGHTLHGKYVSEEDAMAEGDRAAKNERRPSWSDAAKR